MSFYKIMPVRMMAGLLSSLVDFGRGFSDVNLDLLEIVFHYRAYHSLVVLREELPGISKCVG